MISALDQDVGKLLALLDRLGIAENTLVLFSSDNGPHKEGGADPEFFASRGGLRGIKRDLYEGGIRVPAIAHWPGRIAPGGVSDHAWAFWDFLPTCAALAGATAPPGLDGISLAPTLLGQPEAQRSHAHLYWEFHEGGFKQALRAGPWKLVRPGTDAPPELYRLDTDRGETRDLAERHPEVLREMLAALAASRSDSADWPVRRPAA
jgi:arylsulfatase A-like enzyme